MKPMPMVSDHFDSRFKNRMGKITKLGKPSIAGAEPVSVSEDVLRKVTLPRLPQAKHRKQNLELQAAGSSKPAHKKTESISLQQNSHSSLSVSYEPYTLAEYKMLVSRTPKHLGGLGPSSMGSEEWCAAWRLRYKRLTYGLKAD